MAPFDAGLPTKISPLIDGQVPDYIQADHPVFVQFLEAYYKFLESGELTISGTVDQVLLETVSKNYLVLDGTNFAGPADGKKKNNCRDRCRSTWSSDSDSMCAFWPRVRSLYGCDRY